MAVKDVGTNWNRNTRNAIDENDKNLQRQINDLVLGSGDSNAEVVQARGGEKTLNDRLDKQDVKINDNRSQLTKKADESYVNYLETRIEDIIQSSDLDPNKDIEIVDARDGEPTLGTKIRKMDRKLIDLLGGEVKELFTTLIRSNSSPEHYFIPGWVTDRLTEGVRYAFEIVPNTTFTQPTIQIGTTTSGSSMVDTLATDVEFEAGLSFWIEDYTASTSDLGYIRIFDNALNIDTIKVYTYEFVGGRVPALEEAINSGGVYNHQLINELNQKKTELRQSQNVSVNDLEELLEVQSVEGITKNITVPSAGAREKYLLRVGLHYGSEDYTPSPQEIFFDGQSKTDFSDVRFFDSEGNVLKASFGKPVNMDLLEDDNLDKMLKVLSDGTIVGFETGQGILLSEDNGITYTPIPNTANVTNNASSTYNRKDMYPIFVDSSDNIFAYAGAKLYKLYANDNYSTKNEVLDFSWDDNGTTIIPDIQDHGMDENQNGTLIVGADYQPQRNARIFRSLDGGETFELSWEGGYGSEFQHTHHVHADPYSNKVYAGIDDGGTTFEGARILVTEDDGVTWVDITDQLEVRGNDYYPTYFGENYRLGGGESYYNGGGAIYKADGNDSNLDIKVKGLAGVRSYADFGTDDLIVAGLQHARGNSVNQIMISEDKGETWETLYSKQQDIANSSGGGFRRGYKATTLKGDTEPCIVFSGDFGNVKPMRIYKGGNHYYREAYIELENIPDAPIEITAKTGYATEYPYKTLNGGEHEGLVYQVPLNEGIGSHVSDSLGNVAKINGSNFGWESVEEPVRYGDYKEYNEPLFPSSGIKLEKGTTINFGKIPQLNFSKEYTVTFWVNPKNKLAIFDEYTKRSSKVMGLFSAGNIAFINRLLDFGYSETAVSETGLNNVGYSIMSVIANGYAYSDQYFFVAISVDSDGHVKVYLNGGYLASHSILKENNLFPLSKLSEGDFIIGSETLPSAGFLSDIKIYNRVINEKEVMEIYKGW